MVRSLELDRPLDGAVRRQVARRVQSASKALGPQPGVSQDEAIHEARKKLKQLRAILRMVRAELGDRVYTEENRAFRDLARPLSAARDADVMVEWIDRLASPVRTQLVEGAMAQVRAALVSRREQVLQSEIHVAQALPRAQRALRRQEHGLDDWSLHNRGWQTVGPGIVETYRRGRRAMRAAQATDNDLALHRWRKQSKYLRYQLELLAPAWPQGLVALAEQARRLSDRLGDDHDLAVLRQVLLHECRAAGSQGERELTLGLLSARRRQLQADAFRIGSSLYAVKPRAFAAELRRHWDDAASFSAPRTHGRPRAAPASTRARPPTLRDAP